MDFTYRFGGLDHSQHVAEHLRLPLVGDMGARGACLQGLDTAAALRRGVLVVGPKGAGKSIGMQQALSFFRELEAAKFKLDANYQRRQVLLIEPIRDASYRATAVLVAKALQPAYMDKVRGRKKDVNEIRADVLAALNTTHHAVLVLDEAERASDETVLFLRDLMADAEARDPNRIAQDGSGTGASGIGVVVVGDESVATRLGNTSEAAERWVTVVRVDPIYPEQAARVYLEWLPGFAPYVESIGETGWHNYVAATVCRGSTVSFRLLENHVRAYVLFMARSMDVANVAEILFRKEIFENTLGSARWGGQDCLSNGDNGGE